MVPKDEVRRRGTAARTILTPAERVARDGQIVARLQAELDWPHFRRVMIVLPIARQYEIDTWPLPEWLHMNWPRLGVYVPRVQGDALEAVRVNLRTAYKLSIWGIPEPVAGPVLDTGEGLDAVIVPLLGFDAAGNRVGYGRGFYDRFFAAHPVALKVGIGYPQQGVPNGILSEPHDVRLDQIITS